jgi:hypothetical protein
VIAYPIAKSVTFEAYLIDEEDKEGGSALAPPPFSLSYR